MILAFALLAATVTAAAQPQATLCLRGTCSAVDARPLAIEALPADESFVWIAPDATRIVAGTLAAGEKAVPLERADAVAHKITVATSDGARNVAPRFELRCDSQSWSWSLAEVPRRTLMIERVPGACKLTISAEGYKAAARELTAPSLGVVHLHRLPVISGVVADAVTRAPVARADVFLPGGELFATTDIAGRFRKPVDAGWPAELRVEAAGYATRDVSVPGAVADVELAVAMSRGGSIELTLAPPLGQEEVRWELRRIVRDVQDKPVRAGTVAAGVSRVAIGAVAAGAYRVVVAGEGPLQRSAVAVDVQEGVASEAIAQITPSRLELTVTRGGRAYGSATVEMTFRSGDAAWRSKVAVDERGEAVEEIWQSGDYIASVGPAAEHRRLAGGETISWKLNVSDRAIRGRVLDARSGSPIADAQLFFESAGTQSVSLSAADGAFELRHVPEGHYSLVARARGYSDRTVRGESSEDDDTHELRLERVTGHVVRAVNPAGVPLVAAQVWIATRSGIRPAGTTSEDGRVTLPLSSNEHGVAYVLPRSGSFASVSFGAIAERGVEELIVTIPAATAALELVTLTTGGVPLAGVPFLLRVNGIVIPMQVYEEMVQLQGLPLLSDASGRALLAPLPPGRYEIWPLTSAADRRAVESPLPPPAPVNLVLTAGKQTAKLTFKPKE